MLRGSYKKRPQCLYTYMYFIKKLKMLPFVGEEQDQLQASIVTPEAPPKKQRKKPTCPKRGKPRKGHKAALCKDQS